MSNYGVLTTLEVFELKKVKQTDLLCFKKRYEAYKERFADLNLTQDTSKQVVPATIEQCFDRNILQALCTIVLAGESRAPMMREVDSLRDKFDGASNELGASNNCHFKFITF